MILNSVKEISKYRSYRTEIEDKSFYGRYTFIPAYWNSEPNYAEEYAELRESLGMTDAWTLNDHNSGKRGTVEKGDDMFL